MSFFDSQNFSSARQSKEILQIIRFKVILLGNASVGKTSLVTRYVEGSFSGDYQSSTSVDFKIKKVRQNNVFCTELIIWDTCGGEKFQSLTRQYFKEVNGALLIFDLADKNSLVSLENWYDQLVQNSASNVVIYVVASKQDTKEKTELTKDGEAFATSKNLKFYEVSAKTNFNVDELFKDLSTEMFEASNYNQSFTSKSELTLKTNTVEVTFNEKVESVMEKEKVCCCKG